MREREREAEREQSLARERARALREDDALVESDKDEEPWKRKPFGKR